MTMTDDVRAAADRLRNPKPTEAYPWPCDMHEQPAQRCSDMAALSREYLAEHPDGDDELAEAGWLEERGFDWCDCGTAMRRMCGPIEVCVTGDVVMLEKDTHLSLHWSYPGPPKVRQYYGLSDNPTRAEVRRLCESLGDPLKEPPAK